MRKPTRQGRIVGGLVLFALIGIFFFLWAGWIVAR